MAKDLSDEIKKLVKKQLIEAYNAGYKSAIRMVRKYGLGTAEEVGGM